MKRSRLVVLLAAPVVVVTGLLLVAPGAGPHRSVREDQSSGSSPETDGGTAAQGRQAGTFIKITGRIDDSTGVPARGELRGIGDSTGTTLIFDQPQSVPVSPNVAYSLRAWQHPGEIVLTVPAIPAGDTYLLNLSSLLPNSIGFVSGRPSAASVTPFEVSLDFLDASSLPADLTIADGQRPRVIGDLPAVIRGLPDGLIRVLVCPNRSPASTFVCALGPDCRRAQIELPPQAWTGTVQVETSHESGQSAPLVGVRLCEATDDGEEGPILFEGRTDKGGSLRIDGLPPSVPLALHPRAGDAHTFTVFAPIYASSDATTIARIVVRPSKRTEIRFASGWDAAPLTLEALYDPPDSSGRLLEWDRDLRLPRPAWVSFARNSDYTLVAIPENMRYAPVVLSIPDVRQVSAGLSVPAPDIAPAIALRLVADSQLGNVPIEITQPTLSPATRHLVLRPHSVASIGVAPGHDVLVRPAGMSAAQQFEVRVPVQSFGEEVTIDLRDLCVAQFVLHRHVAALSSEAGGHPYPDHETEEPWEFVIREATGGPPMVAVIPAGTQRVRMVLQRGIYDAMLMSRQIVGHWSNITLDGPMCQHTLDIDEQPLVSCRIEVVPGPMAPCWIEIAGSTPEGEGLPLSRVPASSKVELTLLAGCRYSMTLRSYSLRDGDLDEIGLAPVTLDAVPTREGPNIFVLRGEAAVLIRPVGEESSQVERVVAVDGVQPGGVEAAWKLIKPGSSVTLLSGAGLRVVPWESVRDHLLDEAWVRQQK